MNGPGPELKQKKTPTNVRDGKYEEETTLLKKPFKFTIIFERYSICIFIIRKRKRERDEKRRRWREWDSNWSQKKTEGKRISENLTYTRRNSGWWIRTVHKEMCVCVHWKKKNRKSVKKDMRGGRRTSNNNNNL